MWLKTFYELVDRHNYRQTKQSSSNPIRTEIRRANKGVRIRFFDNASPVKKAELDIDCATWQLLKASVDKKFGGELCKSK